jgi:hypothetical protein
VREAEISKGAIVNWLLRIGHWLLGFPKNSRADLDEAVHVCHGDGRVYSALPVSRGNEIPAQIARGYKKQLSAPPDS